MLNPDYLEGGPTPAKDDGQMALLHRIAGGMSNMQPAQNAAAVTPHDETVIEARALWIGTGGDLVATIGGTDVTFLNVPSGSLLPVAATKVKAATDAEDIVALW